MSDTELEALETWIQKVTKIQFKQKRFLDNLRDGVVLCVLVSKIKGKKVMYNRNPRGLDFMEKVFLVIQPYSYPDTRKISLRLFRNVQN